MTSGSQPGLSVSAKPSAPAHCSPALTCRSACRSRARSPSRRPCPRPSGPALRLRSAARSGLRQVGSRQRCRSRPRSIRLPCGRVRPSGATCRRRRPPRRQCPWSKETGWCSLVDVELIAVGHGIGAERETANLVVIGIGEFLTRRPRRWRQRSGRRILRERAAAKARHNSNADDCATTKV